MRSTTIPRLPSVPFLRSSPARRRIAAAFILAAAFLSGCGRPASRDTLFHAVSYPPFFSLDPATDSSDSAAILRNVYETLTVYDDRDGEVKPCLAESWKSNATRTEWTFTLRRDVLFHDGTPLTAAAVKRSIERVMLSGQGASSIWDCVSSIEARGSGTVVFRLNYAAPLPLIASATCAAYIISPAAADKDEAWFSAGNDAGSGPYRIAAVSRTSVALEAFGGYRGGWGKDKYKKVFVAEIPSRNRRMEYLRAGSADIVFFPDLGQAAGLEGCALRVAPSWQSLVMLFNVEKEPCSSEDFRKALAYAFPYEETAGRILKGQVALSKGIVPPGLWAHDDGLPGYSCDLALARDYLGRTDYAGGPLTLSYQRTRDELVVVLDLYRRNLEAIGVNLILMESDRDSQKRLAANPDPGERQDILLVNWWPDYADPAGIFRALLSDLGQGRGHDFSFLRDAEISFAIRKASMLTMEDRDEAAAIYRSLQRKVYDRCSLVFLYDSAIPIAYREGISGLRINPAYASSISYYDLRR